MIDINFYMKIHDLKQRIISGEGFDKEFVLDEFERCRSKSPVIFNIETTNACNMRCQMCPRTTMMTRKVETLDMETFDRILEQIHPYTEEQWQQWQEFAEEKYNVKRNGMGENHFFLHILPRVLILHGFGDPLLDVKIAERIKRLTGKGLASYFSCNPANIDIEKNLELFESGLSYVKYSIDSVDDLVHKQVRGKASDFSESYRKIIRLLEEKMNRNYKTTIIITMIDMNRENQQEDFQKLKTAFEGFDVYIYLKSLDQQWYLEQERKMGSIHWQEFCQFPWSSMTIKSNGEVAMCGQDFNNEIILGEAGSQSLYDIWNGQKYVEFRNNHFDLDGGIRCTQRCDMKVVGELLGERVCT